MLACACGLYCRIQSQNVGLEGDAINHANDVCNPLAGVVDAAHGADHFFHYLPTLLSHLAGVDGQLVGLPCTVGVLADCAAQLFHGGCRLLQSTGLLFSAYGKVMVALRNLLAGHGDTFCTAAYPLHDVGNIGAHALQPIHHTACVGLVRQAGAQIPLGHLLRDGEQARRLGTQLLQDAAGNGPSGDQQQHGKQQ